MRGNAPSDCGKARDDQKRPQEYLFGKDRSDGFTESSSDCQCHEDEFHDQLRDYRSEKSPSESERSIRYEIQSQKYSDNDSYTIHSKQDILFPCCHENIVIYLLYETK